MSLYKKGDYWRGLPERCMGKLPFANATAKYCGSSLCGSLSPDDERIAGSNNGWGPKFRRRGKTPALASADVWRGFLGAPGHAVEDWD